jgi:sugar (pentulose or hexulose) kinase
VIFNLTLSNTKADIARAVLEAIALELSDNLKIIEENTSAIEKVSVAGGLTRLDLFNMIQADAFSRAVVRYPDPEATSKGSLILACSSLGIYESIEEGFEKIAAGNSREFMPDAEKGEIYRNYSALRKKLYTAISGSSLYTDFYSFQKEQEKKKKGTMI